jgi:hypothetical protein
MTVANVEINLDREEVIEDSEEALLRNAGLRTKDFKHQTRCEGIFEEDSKISEVKKILEEVEVTQRCEEELELNRLRRIIRINGLKSILQAKRKKKIQSKKNIQNKKRIQRRSKQLDSINSATFY